MKTAGLIFDDSRHYIDHLAPFCALEGIPLIVCEPAVRDLARRYYPDLEILEADLQNLSQPPALIACDPRYLIESAFPATLLKELYWLPHGNSDKGWKNPIFKPLRGETALVYGQKMIDFMNQQSVSLSTIRVGNFRLHYWKKHRLFYETIFQQEIPLPKANKTYLYAPTWDDSEGNGSFWEMFPLLEKHLPDHCNLIVKIHPNTQTKFMPEIEQLIGKYAKRENIFFLLEFPPIYPLLSMCDAYIGDMSSIGYDFLYWQRPMYFLNNKDRSQFLYQCGIEITPEKIKSIFDSVKSNRKHKQEEIYRYTFDPYSPLSAGKTNTIFKSFK